MSTQVFSVEMSRGGRRETLGKDREKYKYPLSSNGHLSVVVSQYNSACRVPILGYPKKRNPWPPTVKIEWMVRGLDHEFARPLEGRVRLARPFGSGSHLARPLGGESHSARP
jgi:hypothetical protein